MDAFYAILTLLIISKGTDFLPAYLELLKSKGDKHVKQFVSFIEVNTESS